MKVLFAFCLTLMVVSTQAFFTDQMMLQHRSQEAADKIHTTLHNVNHFLQGVQQRLQNQHGFKLMSNHLQTLSTTCENALIAGSSVASACTTNSTLAIVSGSPDEINTALISYCSDTGCAGQITTLLNNLKAACTAAELSELNLAGEAFETAVSQLRLPCLKYNNEFCFPKLYTAINSLTGPNYTVSQLDQLCSPCTRIILSAYHTEGESNFGAFDQLCEKSNGEYCFLFYQRMPRPHSDDPEVLINFLTEYYCKSQCGLFLVQREDDSNSDDAVSFTKMFCVLDESGQPCIKRIFALTQTSSPPDCPDEPRADTTCSATCASDLRRVLSSLGCCSGTLFSILAQSSNGTAEVRQFVNKCGVSVPSECAGRGAVAITLAVKNLAYSYYTQNKTAVEAKLKRDVASAAGASSDDVTIESATQSATGVTFKIKISTVSVEQATQMKSQLDTAITANALALPEIAALPVTARIDPVVSTSVDSTASATTAVDLSAAAGLSASVLLIAAVAVVNLFKF